MWRFASSLSRGATSALAGCASPAQFCAAVPLLARGGAAQLGPSALFARGRRTGSGGKQGVIHKMTRLNVIDNSGAKEIQCIGHVLRKPARIGDAIRVVVKKARPDGRVSRKDILAAVVVRQKGIFRRPDGSTIRFQENAAVLLKRDRSGPVGTRVTGPVARELRQGKWMKIIMMASRVV